MSIFENFQKLGKIKHDNSDYEYQSFNDEDEEDEKVDLHLTWYIVPLIVFIAIFSYQLFKLQIVSGAQNQVLAQGNRLREEELPAPRGLILDDKGESLVTNIPQYNLEINPLNLPAEKKDRIKVYETLKEYLGDTEETNNLIKDVEDNKLYSTQEIKVKSLKDRNEAMLAQLKFNNIAGVQVDVVPSRKYDTSTGLSLVLGYVGKISEERLKNDRSYSMTDLVGQNGLELAYEEYLRGTKGSKKVEVDSTGKVQRELNSVDPEVGNNIVSTLDLGLQKKATEILSAMINSLKDKDVKHGVVVVSNPQTGGIMAMVSIPYYDNNLFIEGMSNEEYEKLINDENQPMFNRVISGVYPSGSVIKPVIAAAGLDTGVVSDSTTINDPGEIKIDEWSFPDWKNHGIVDIKKAIAESCDVFFYAIGGGWEDIKGIGVDTMKKYLERFGFGKSTGIELSGEESGTIPDPAWKKETKDEDWYLGDTYHMAIGQGDFLVTPLQILNATSAIANGGTLYKPHLVNKVTDKDGKTIKEFSSEKISTSLTDNNVLSTVQEGMKQCVESDSGSCRLLKDIGVSAAGKTGTAQFDANDLKKTHAWFTAYAPYDNPEIAITVLVEKGGDGFDSAEPVARDILKYYFEHKNDKPKTE